MSQNSIVPSEAAFKRFSERRRDEVGLLVLHIALRSNLRQRPIQWSDHMILLAVGAQPIALRQTYKRRGRHHCMGLVDERSPYPSRPVR